MKFTTGLIIGLLSVIAAVAEFILYMIFGMALSLSEQAQSGFASFAIWVIFMTLTAGFIAPICGGLESLSERKNLGLKLFGVGMILVAFFWGAILIASKTLPSAPASTSYSRGVVR